MILSPCRVARAPRFPAFFITTIFIILHSLSASAAVAGKNEVIHDDTSTFFSYTGRWLQNANGLFAKPEPGKTHGGTWHDGNLADLPGGSCKFFGRGIVIYGIEIWQQGNVKFQLDNRAPVTWEHDSGGAYIYDSEWFRAVDLDPKVEHTLTFAVGRNSITNGTTVLLDYARVLLPIEEVTTSSTETRPSSTGTAVTTERTTVVTSVQDTTGTNAATKTSGSMTGDRPQSSTRSGDATTNTVGRASPSSTQTSTQNGENKVEASSILSSPESDTSSNARARGPSTGVIAGAVVAGVVVCVLLALVAIMCIRRRRRSREWQGMESPSISTSTMRSVHPSTTLFNQDHGNYMSQPPLAPVRRPDDLATSSSAFESSSSPSTTTSEKHHLMSEGQGVVLARTTDNVAEADEDDPSTLDSRSGDTSLRSQAPTRGTAQAFEVLEERVRQLEQELADHRPPPYQ